MRDGVGRTWVDGPFKTPFWCPTHDPAQGKGGDISLTRRFRRGKKRPGGNLKVFGPKK